MQIGVSVSVCELIFLSSKCGNCKISIARTQLSLSYSSYICSFYSSVSLFPCTEELFYRILLVYQLVHFWETWLVCVLSFYLLSLNPLAFFLFFHLHTCTLTCKWAHYMQLNGLYDRTLKKHDHKSGKNILLCIGTFGIACLR